MHIEQFFGIVATLNHSPYFSTEACRNQCKTIRDNAIAASGCAPTNQVDVHDESILIFADSYQALEFLVNVLRSAAKLKSHSDCELSLRASLCQGDYFIHGENIYGEAVNLATRLACASRKSELLVCGIDHQIIKEFVKAQDDVACFVRNQEEGCMSIGLLDQEKTGAHFTSRVLEIEYKNDSWTFEQSRLKKIEIGRSPDSDIRINANHISRNHATITLHDDKIFVEDHSANGTYIYLPNREIFLNHDSKKMDHGGHISCGLPRSNKTPKPDLISFRLKEASRSAA